jgi:vitamin B12 transporter
MLALLVALLATGGLQGSGSLAGIVQTPDGLAVPRLTITVTGSTQSIDVVTDDTGRFRVTALPSGEYRLTLASQLFALRAPVSLSLHGQDDHVSLVVVPAGIRESVTVSAPSAETLLSASPGTTVSVMTEQQIQSRDAPSFAQLIQGLPGVSVSRSGGVGSTGSVYVRGGESNYALVLIDGVIVSDPGGAYDFGKQLPLELERIEITRGVPSSEYGGGLSGLFSLTTRSAKVNTGPLASGDLELGSFRWRRVLGSTSGRTDHVDWNVGVLGVTTDNQQPNSAFRQGAAAMSIGVALDAQTSLRIVARADISATGDPGPSALIPPNLHANEDSDTGVVGARLHHAGRLVAHEWRVNFSLSDKLALNPSGPGPLTVRAPATATNSTGPTFFIPDFSSQDGLQNNTRRLTLAYHGEGLSLGRHFLMFGADVERETGALGVNGNSATGPRTTRGPLQGLGITAPSRLNEAAYAQDRLTFHDDLALTTGVRVEHNGSFGVGVSPRATVAWTVRAGRDSTTLKSSAGAGIKEPTFEQSFGETFYERGNATLKPERSRTFDVGVDQRLLDGRLRAEATFFDHQYRDQIVLGAVTLPGLSDLPSGPEGPVMAGDSVPQPIAIDFNQFRPQYANVSRTRAQGLELSGDGRFAGVGVRGQYTSMNARVIDGGGGLEPGDSLPGRPRREGSMTLDRRLGRLTLGATGVYVGARRATPSFLTAALGLTEEAAYFRLDTRALLQLTTRLALHIAVENTLNHTYQETLGYPALGRSVRAGFRLTFGAGRRSSSPSQGE